MVEVVGSFERPSWRDKTFKIAFSKLVPGIMGWIRKGLISMLCT